MAIISVVVDEERAEAALAAFALRGFADLMEIVGTLVEAQTRRRISTEKTAPDGSPWAPLKAATVARRRKNSKGILNDTGRLLGSISHTSSAFSATVGTSVEYAPFHQYGTRKMVARPFLGVSAANMEQIKQAVDTWVEGIF